MAGRTVNADVDRFQPIERDAEWDEQGWSAESEPLTAASRLEARISIHFDADSAALIREAASYLGLSRSEFVRRAAVQSAAEAVRETKGDEEPSSAVASD
jgi:hypothetical protein